MTPGGGPVYVVWGPGAGAGEARAAAREVLEGHPGARVAVPAGGLGAGRAGSALPGARVAGLPAASRLARESVPRELLRAVRGAVLCPGGGGGGAAGCGPAPLDELTELEALLDFLSRRCPRVKCVVLLSSAYVAAPRVGRISPQPLPEGATCGSAATLGARLGLPDTMILRKAAAEAAAAEWARGRHHVGFSLEVLRPSLVGAPERGDFGTGQGDLTPLQGLLALALVGVLRTVRAPAGAKADIVPLDVVGQAAARLLTEGSGGDAGAEGDGGARRRRRWWWGIRKIPGSAGYPPRVHHCVRGLARCSSISQLASACNDQALMYQNRQLPLLWRFVASDSSPRAHKLARHLEGSLPVLLAKVAPVLGRRREQAATTAARMFSRVGDIHDSQALAFFTRHVWDFEPDPRDAFRASGAAAAQHEARAVCEALSERGALARTRPPNWRAEYCVQQLLGATRRLFFPGAAGGAT